MFGDRLPILSTFAIPKPGTKINAVLFDADIYVLSGETIFFLNKIQSKRYRKYLLNIKKALLWIRDILVRIRIRESVQLTYGSGSCSFRQWLQDATDEKSKAS